MEELRRTALHGHHAARGANLVAYGGWEMPLSYPSGILREHLATRRGAGLFDISHMGRFLVRGGDGLAFLQRVLTNNAEALEVDRYQAQYTLLATETGGAVDDCYLYRLGEADYLLVVNAANRAKDWDHLVSHRRPGEAVSLSDATEELAMVALQGPLSRGLLARVLDDGRLPEPQRNELSRVSLGGVPVRVARTGYTGEPLCFELFVAAPDAGAVWERLAAEGATPVGLGARDTLRLEAGLPLYGHELGLDPEGGEIPIFALPLAKSAVSFAPHKGDFVGRAALARQQAAFRRITFRDYALRADLPRLVQALAVTGEGVARAGDRVVKDGRPVGTVTSGTRVPYWLWSGEGLLSEQTERHALRSLALALVECDLVWDDRVFVEVRGRPVEAVVVECHLRGDAPPFARPLVFGHEPREPALPDGAGGALVSLVLRKTADNTRWRQTECINLIPSEMTASPAARLAASADPSARYAEHKQVAAFYDTDVYYYQGTDFIQEAERLLARELKRYLGCHEVEARLTSGQLANTAVFGALVEYVNRAEPKAEPRRLRQCLTHHLTKGGHLSAQPLGALREFVARDPRTERPAVRDFPVQAENPFRVDVRATCEVIDRYRPELLVFGKSVFLYREPVAEIRRFLDDQGLNPLVLYDGAHVLGLLGPHFQDPFAEGADFVSGSTHKTFFGTQRGLVGSRFREHDERYELWEALQRRTFPGSVSNHHLGTLVGLFVAACEMNHFRDEYQRLVLSNARAFAAALDSCGLEVAGDAASGYTETHQVLVRAGYAKGAAAARKLEDNNLLCNFQAGPDEEGFTAAGWLRLGVAEMTRFGLGSEEFSRVAELVADVLLRGADVRAEVVKLRRRHTHLRFTFDDDDCGRVLEELRRLV